MTDALVPGSAAAVDLVLQPITAASFAPYGWLVDADDAAHVGGAATRPINGGSSLRIDGLSPLALQDQGGAPCLAVFRARGQDPRGPWAVLERHALGTQTFIPLGGARCVVLVALGEDDGQGSVRPDRRTLAAFEVGGRQAFTLRAGTWHHGLLAREDGVFVVIERRGAQEDCELATLDPPVLLGC